MIPANDDAVGSIKFIADAVAEAYKEGKETREKDLAKEAKRAEIATAKAAKEKKTE